MKTAMIYFSLEGNMDSLAQKLSAGNDIDLYRLIPQKNYPQGKVSKFLWGGFSITIGEKPKLEELDLDLDKYDTLIIGTPVWASTFAPPLNTFFHKYEIQGKNVLLMATFSGGGADKCMEKMKTRLPGNRFIGTFSFIDPLSHQDSSVEEKIKAIQQILKENA